MKTISINLYSFDELNDKAKQKAIDKLANINVNSDWWSMTYDDAKDSGLIITSFDLDRNRHAKGKFNFSAKHCAELIIKNHGEHCETYKTANSFLIEYRAIETATDKNGILLDQEEQDDKIIDLESDFLTSLLEDYSVILQNECEYLTSDEAIIETIEANDYTFEENGTMNNSN